MDKSAPVDVLVPLQAKVEKRTKGRDTPLGGSSIDFTYQ
jgi:hypothetical protein